MTDTESARTRAFASALGPFLVIFGGAVALRAAEMPLFIPAFFSNAILVFVTGAFTLGLGLAMLAAHRHMDSLAAIIVTVFGFVTAVRGALLLIAPSLIASLAANIVHVPGIVLIPAFVAMAIGVYLIAVSWFAKRA
jgi:hypothetical protein